MIVPKIILSYAGPSIGLKPRPQDTEFSLFGLERASNPLEKAQLFNKFFLLYFLGQNSIQRLKLCLCILII